MSSRLPVKPGMSSSEVNDLYGSVRDASRIADARRDLAAPSLKKVGERAVDAIEVAAGAAAVGFVAGRTGSTSIGPVPTGLAIAAAYYAAEAFDFVPGSWSKHLENVLGKGALAGFATMWAAGQGYLMKQAAEGGAKPAPALAAGMPSAMMGCAPASGQPHVPAAIVPGRLTEAELQAIDQRRRQR